VGTGEASLVLRTDPKRSVECVAFSPDGSTIAGGGENQKVILWDAATGAVLGELGGHADWVNALAFSPDGRLLATAGSYSDATVRLWDVASRTTVAVLRQEPGTGAA